MGQNKVNEQIETQIKKVLRQTASKSIIDSVVFDDFIAQHVWRDSSYVGIHNGKVAVWRGWRLRVPVLRAKDQIIYIDLVDNVLSRPERQRLFGQVFAQAVDGLGEFVVMYTTGFPRSAYAKIVEQGFTPRELTYALHACDIKAVDLFLAESIEELTAAALSLLNLRQSVTRS